MPIKINYSIVKIRPKHEGKESEMGGKRYLGAIWAQNKRARHHVGPACLLQTLYLMKTSSEGGLLINNQRERSTAK